MSNTSFWDHPIDKLEEALSIRKQISSLQAKLSDLFGSPASTPKASKKSRKRTVSSATRAKMVAAQQARHAKKTVVAAVEAAPAKVSKSAKAAKKKGGITPEGRAKLAAAMKARWAARKNAA
jgi:hypothetical protein